MTRVRADLLLLLVGAVGCGIAQRTVDEAKAGDSGSGGSGGALSAAGNGSAGAKPVAIGGNGGVGGMPGVAGAPDGGLCAATGNAAPLRRLSRWEYQRSVKASTRVPASADGAAALVDDPREGPFSFAMSWSAASAGYVLAEAERQGAAARDGRLLPCDVTQFVDGACATAFVDTFVGRAFRRPLSDAERSRYVSLFKLGAGKGDMAAGVELVVAAALFSPIFLHKLYLGNGVASAGQTQLTGFELAARLSYLLAGEPPDAALSDAAKNGALATAAGVQASARRLLEAPGFRDAVTHFHAQWLDLDQLDSFVSGDLPLELLSSMRTDTERFVVDVFMRERTLPVLLQSSRAFVDDRLATRSDVAAPPQAFAEVALDPSRYFGVLTRASTLTRFNNPTQRGKFVRERLLCDLVPPPPPQIPKQIEVLPGQSRRQAYEQHVSDPSCAGCHSLMDHLGFAFENFDELGLYRVNDNGLQVDASGALMDEEIGGDFVGVGELASRLSRSRKVGKCLTKTWLSYALQRPAAMGDQCAVETAYAAFADAQLDMAELLVALVVSPQFRSRDAFVAPMLAPFPGVMGGSADTAQGRRKLLLENAIGEMQWLRNGVPKEDLMVLEQYLSALRDLEIQLSQGVPEPQPAPSPD